MKNKLGKKLGVVTSLLAVAALVLAGCGGSSSGTAGTLRLASAVAPNTLNQIRNSESINSEIIGQYLEGLVQYNADNELVGAVAKDWTTNEDGSVYTFNIRPESKWTNGQPVTANDFVFAWSKLATDKEATYGYLVSAIKNGQAVLDGTMDASELGVKAVSDSQLEVTLEQPLAYFLDLMAFPPFFPTNEAFYNEVGGDEVYGTSMETVLGNGPFTLTKYKADEGWEFAKNPDYWDAASVQLNVVTVRFVAETSTQGTLYDNGEIDRLGLTGDLIDKYSGSSEIVTQPETAVFYFYLSGTTNSPDATLANKNVRAAIAHAIDKSVITDNVLKNGSLPIDYLVPKDFVSLDGEDFRTFANQFNDPMFDVKKAQEFLDAAKKELGQDTLSVTLAVADTEAGKKIYENIESQLETNLEGLDVTINQVPQQTYYPLLQEYGTPAANAGWGADYMDVATYFEIFRSDDSHNYGKWNNPEFDQLFKDAQSPELATNPTERWNKFVQAEAVLINDYAIIPIYQRASMALVKPNVKGFKLYPTAPDMRYKYVTVE
ncbi:peptide ABC transporter substrate-binding protein [Culicoidibacter larvae]|uniref:Peptide ABC transporter substrate-binding protein n=1 Tax=Culicoidibacter larvae TaxID=2579976 RepID=A0A5R8QB77_9FIRM|nr:peptide ABC transporter substrate-binding protein [Culicoidibacter larvae]TLG73831.1 peptide ABC transporter substrate-binding protein [Culicoidibacter larvae]